MASNDKIRNVGPKSAAWLRQVGVRTQADLEALGAVAAFMKVKRAGFRPSLNLVYSLEGALMGCHWQQVPEERRSELLLAVDSADAVLQASKGRPVGSVTTEYGPAADVYGAEEEPTGFLDSDPEAEASSDSAASD
jgi:DNA transformation protein and related proteins